MVIGICTSLRYLLYKCVGQSQVFFKGQLIVITQEQGKFGYFRPPETIHIFGHTTLGMASYKSSHILGVYLEH